MIDIDLDQARIAYAEGYDDGYNHGNNLNPFDYDDQPNRWQSYEQGFMSAILEEVE